MTDHLPAGWIWATLDDVIVSMRNGISTKPVGNEGIPILRISAVRPNVLDLTDIRYLETEPDGNVDYTLRTGDLLFTRYNGTRSLVGVCAHVPEGVGRVVYPDKLIRVRVNEALACPRYVQFASNSGVSRAFIESRARTTAGQTGVSGGDLRAMPLPLPTLPEQRRIVAALEEHLSALDAAVACLTRARGNVRRFADATISSAVAPRDGWSMTPLRELGMIKGGVTKGQKRRADEVLRAVPYLRVANVQRGRLDLGEVRTIEATEREIADLRLFEGDVLFNEGGDRDKLGRGWVWDGQLDECIHQNHVFRARFDRSVVEPRFVSHYANSHGQRYFLDQGTQTTNLASISMRKLGALPVPLPPIEEQQRILSTIDDRLGIAERTYADIDVQLARAARLRQSILQRAFSGGLVPQDPAESPVSTAPEPDRTERSSAPSPSRPARGRGRTARTGGRRG